MNNPKPEAVVFIHGLFMNGSDMSLLRERVSEAGFVAHQFSYDSVGTDIKKIVEDLHIFVEALESDVVHYVCHSLGGLIIRHYLHAYPDATPGRTVTLGTPHNGSGAAHFFNQYNMASMLLGQSLKAGLLGNAPDWIGERELGVIAGDLSLGLGNIFSGLEEPNDGTVSVSETLLENCRAHLCLPVSHTGLVLSKTASDETVKFLIDGKFSHI